MGLWTSRVTPTTRISPMPRSTLTSRRIRERVENVAASQLDLERASEVQWTRAWIHQAQLAKIKIRLRSTVIRTCSISSRRATPSLMETPLSPPLSYRWATLTTLLSPTALMMQVWLCLTSQRATHQPTWAGKKQLKLNVKISTLTQSMVRASIFILGSSRHSSILKTLYWFTR